MTLILSGSDGVTFPDSTEQETGYANGIGFRNRIINGDMRIDQRNAGAAVTVAAGGGYALDRFNVQSDLGSGSTMQRVAEAPEGFAYSQKLTIGTGATPTGSQFGRLIYYVEGQDCIDFDWTTASAKAVTLSFWTRSSLTGTFGVCLKLQAGSPYTSFFASYTINSANTWEYKTITIPAATMTAGTRSTTNGIGILVAWDLGEGPDRSTTAGYKASADGGTLGLTGGTKVFATSGATWQITGVQLEVGSVATPFERRPYGTELMLCQRYYQQFDSANNAASGAGFAGVCGTTAIAVVTGTYLVEMRAAPTVTFNNININYGGATSTVTALSSYASIRALGADMTVTGTPLTIGRAAVVQFIGGASNSNRIAFSAEL